jgi:hypothetical protein
LRFNSELDRCSRVVCGRTNPTILIHQNFFSLCLRAKIC